MNYENLDITEVTFRLRSISERHGFSVEDVSINGCRGLRLHHRHLPLKIKVGIGEVITVLTPYSRDNWFTIQYGMNDVAVDRHNDFKVHTGRHSTFNSPKTLPYDHFGYFDCILNTYKPQYNEIEAAVIIEISKALKNRFNTLDLVIWRISHDTRDSLIYKRQKRRRINGHKCLVALGSKDHPLHYYGGNSVIGYNRTYIDSEEDMVEIRIDTIRNGYVKSIIKIAENIRDGDFLEHIRDKLMKIPTSV